MSDLYVLRPPAPGPDAVSTRYTPVEMREGDLQRCAECRGVLNPPLWLPPIKVTLEARGGQIADVVFGPHTDLLVSEDFALRWNRTGPGALKGLSGFEPVTVVSVGGDPVAPRPLLHVRVGLSAARLDDKESEVQRTGGAACELCGGGGVLKRFRRLNLHPTPAPSEDLFVARGLLHAVLASPGFFARFGAGKATGFTLVAAEAIRAL